MHENEFEKQVREKMEQLDFDPSESVWTGVNMEINKDKKRRVPFFWLFFLPGLLLAGGAYYFVASNNTPVKSLKLPEQSDIAKKQSNEPATQSIEPQKDIQKISNDRSAEPQNNIRKTPNGKTANDAKIAVHNSLHSANSANQNAAGYSGNQKLTKKEKQTTNGLSEENNSSPGNAAVVGTGATAADKQSSKPETIETENKNKKISDSTVGKIVTAKAANNSKKDSVTNTATAKNKEQKTKHSAWRIGYTLNAGFSNLNQDLFNSVKTLSLTTNLASTPPGNINRGTVTYSSSPIHAGFSFAAGAFVTRDLSKRFSFSAGINYHYYSTKMNTGSEVDAALYSVNAYSPFIPGNIYYENGNTQSFTNQYHFIEIPLSVNYRLNKSKKTPIIWELGLTPGYIISSNALYYDPNTNLYSNKYLQPNKMQLNGVTALMVGVPLHSGELQIGPQVQYGFTGFVNTSDGNPGHLFYAGLKISFIPRKK